MVFSAMTLVAVFLVCLGPATAQELATNQIGLYLNPEGPDGSGVSGTSEIGVPVSVYLVMTRPVDVQNGNAPYPTINAFECQLNFDPAPVGTLFKLADTLPANSVNVGDNADINQGYLEYIVGIDTNNPVQVVDEAAVLIWFQFMNVSTGRTTVSLGLTSAPSIPGEIAFQSVSGQLRVMYPASGSFNEPVFEFNGEAVAVDNESFGSVKALFR